MPANTDCLQGLTGLTRAGSQCFPLPAVTAPATNDAYTASTTGLYVDELPALSLRPAPAVNGATDVWQQLDKARNQALNTVAMRLTRGTADMPKYTTTGQLGGEGNGAYQSVSGAARATFRTRHAEGGALLLTAARLLTDTLVLDAPLLLDGVQVGTISTNSPGPVSLAQGGYVAPGYVSDGYVQDATPGLLIPYDGQTHTLEALLPDGVRVRANAITCGCSNPFVTTMRQRLQDVTGSAGGFTLSVREVCTEDTLLCHALSTDEELARSAAFAIQYLTGANFAASLLTEANYSRYTILEPKQLDALGAGWTEKAEEHLQYLLSPDGLARVQHPCFVCRPAAWHPTKQRIS